MTVAWQRDKEERESTAQIDRLKKVEAGLREARHTYGVLVCAVCVRVRACTCVRL